ncbi:DUF4336 domain-containing protein [Pelagerythrobacter rhizovicinus]|uniref:DUF4336 domain-containing protein n=1 Tax=Pelagerythrobacter rhizovicinus TaxID=2268576 RepID=A0A4Q2KIC8_9SPHN|nr:DUF4336 domain-containing protein [Pelagerythrobacter rhizovicinus]RXZ63920.1 DUF4336 domain-containing protein [Pelagerythrobacter rhizovicinus]
MSAFVPYEPLNTPKPFAEDVWIVDGPEIRMDYGPASLPFPTRMTVVRLSSGELWVHSPIAPDPALFEQVEALGRVRYLVAPNSLHYWYMADWLERYPEATSHAVPGLEKAKRRFRIDQVLTAGERMEWEGEIAWVLVPGTAVTEAVFFVRRGRVAVLTDLIENFEPARVRSRLLRWLIGLAKANGSTPLDMRATYLPRRREVARAVREILDWPADKVVMAHGLPYGKNGAAELQRGLGWTVRRDRTIRRWKPGSRP